MPLNEADKRILADHRSLRFVKEPCSSYRSTYPFDCREAITHAGPSANLRLGTSRPSGLEMPAEPVAPKGRVCLCCPAFLRWCK